MVEKTLAHYENKAKSRDDAIKEAYASGAYSMQELGGYFGFHHSWVSRIVNGEAKSKT